MFSSSVCSYVAATFPHWGRLKGRASHYEEDPNAARCPTGSTSLRSAQDDGVIKPPSGREGDRGAVEGARRE